jgi:hypothetical protein
MEESNDWQAEVIENSFFEHFFRLSPAQPLLFYDLIQCVRASVMRIQNKKLAFP